MFLLFYKIFRLFKYFAIKIRWLSHDFSLLFLAFFDSFTIFRLIEVFRISSTFSGHFKPACDHFFHTFENLTTCWYFTCRKIFRLMQHFWISFWHIFIPIHRKLIISTHHLRVLAFSHLYLKNYFKKKLFKKNWKITYNR